MEKAYTVKELDVLRAAVWKRYRNQNQIPSELMSQIVEDQVRTHMLAGHSAQDIADTDALYREENRKTAS